MTELVARFDNVLVPAVEDLIVLAFKGVLSKIKYYDITPEGTREWKPVPCHYGYRLFDDVAAYDTEEQDYKGELKYPKITVAVVHTREDKARNPRASDPTWRDKEVDPSGNWVTLVGQPKFINFTLQVTIHVRYNYHMAVIEPQIYNWLPDAFAIALEEHEPFGVKKVDESPRTPPIEPEEEITKALRYDIFAQQPALRFEELPTARSLIVTVESPGGNSSPEIIRVTFSQ